MLTTVGAILARAQGRVPFYERRLCPPSVQRGMLTDVVQELVARLATATPDYLLLPTTVLVPPAIATTQAALPARTHVFDVEATLTDGNTAPVEVLPVTERRLFPRGFLAVAEDGAGLWFLGLQEDWAQVASLTIRYGPLQPPFTDDADMPVLPDAAESALVLTLAVMIAERMVGVGGVEAEAAGPLLQRLTGQATSAVEAFMKLATFGQGPRAHRVVDAW